MKLLIITNNPSRPSFRQRIAIHVDRLEHNGINCTIKKFPADWKGRYRLLRSARDYDAVFLHKRRLNPFNAFFLRRYARKIIYDFDDAVMYNDESPEKYSAKRQKTFARTVELCDLVIVGNSYLARHARQYNSNVHILPTALAVKDYVDLNVERTDNLVRLVWIGTKATLKYLENLRISLEEIGRKYDNVVLRIICDAHFDLEHLPVEKVHWSIETQAKDLAESDIGLAPLPDNPFTQGKCGFKILQYAAAGLAVVASPVGINSEFVTDGENGSLAEDHEWTEKLKKLIESKELRKKFSLQNRKFVRDYDVEVIGDRLVDLFRKL